MGTDHTCEQLGSEAAIAQNRSQGPPPHSALPAGEGVSGTPGPQLLFRWASHSIQDRSPQGDETRTGLPWGAGTLQGEEGLGRARGKREESVSWAVPHTAPTGQTDTCPCAFRGTLLDRGQSLPASSLGTLRWFSDESLREAGYGMAVTIRVARRVIPAERVIV